MEESLLQKLAWACSIIGIVGLFVVSEVIEYPAYAKGDGKVSFAGKVKAVDGSGNVLRISLESDDGRDLKIVAFDAPNLNLSDGARIKGIGEKTSFRGSTELVAFKILNADG